MELGRLIKSIIKISPLWSVAPRILLCILVLLTLFSSETYAKALIKSQIEFQTAENTFVGPSIISIDGALADWGTPSAPTSGIYLQQDASNSGTDDGSGISGTLDLNYVWMGMATQNGGSAPASASNNITAIYYRIDTFSTATFSNSKYNIQLNLGTAGLGYADHLLQLWVDNGSTPKVKMVLMQYQSPYPAMKAFTTGSLTGVVSNVASPYSGYTGAVDASATGLIGTYNYNSTTYYGFEIQVPVSWFGPSYGGAVKADGSGASSIVGAVFTSTGSFGSVGTVKDTINDGNGATLISSTSTSTGSTSFVTTNIVKLAFTSAAQTLTAGSPSATSMTVQTQDTLGAAQNVSSTTTINLSTSSTGGSFSLTSGGTYSSTLAVTIVSGSSSTSFFYKDTKAGTPTITGTPQGQTWTPATQQETVNPAALHHFSFGTITSPQIAGVAFSITITAQDQYNNTVTSYTGTPNLSVTAGNISPLDATGGFSSGTWTNNVIISGATGSESITATDSSITGTSGSFNLNALNMSIGNSPGSYGFGVVVTSSTNSISTGYFTLTNNGNVPVNVTISGTDMGTWVLSNTATPGDNTVGLEAGTSQNSHNFNIIIKKTTPYNILVTGLTPGNSITWELQLLAPTSFSDGGAKSGTITLTATQSGG